MQAEAGMCQRPRGRSRMSYGHIGLRFDAKTAQFISYQRDKRFRDVYDKILLRCLKQIQQDCVSYKSMIFQVPSTLATELLPYEVDEVMRYLVVALGEDRHFTVMRLNDDTLYVRWEPPDPKGGVAASRAIIQPPAAAAVSAEPVSSLIPINVSSRRRTAKKAKEKDDGTVAVNTAKQMQDVDAIIASLAA